MTTPAKISLPVMFNDGEREVPMGTVEFNPLFMGLQSMKNKLRKLLKKNSGSLRIYFDDSDPSSNSRKRILITEEEGFCFLHGRTNSNPLLYVMVEEPSSKSNIPKKIKWRKLVMEDPAETHRKIGVKVEDLHKPTDCIPVAANVESAEAGHDSVAVEPGTTTKNRDSNMASSSTNIDSRPLDDGTKFKISFLGEQSPTEEDTETSIYLTNLKESIIRLQSVVRGVKDRKKYGLLLERHRAAVVIQSVVRRWLVRRRLGKVQIVNPSYLPDLHRRLLRLEEANRLLQHRIKQMEECQSCYKSQANGSEKSPIDLHNPTDSISLVEQSAAANVESGEVGHVSESNTEDDPKDPKAPDA